MIPRSSLILLMLWLTWIHPAYAVDGVGIDEMFPFLKWIFIVPLCFMISFFTYYKLSSITEGKGIILNFILPVILASIPLLPVAYPLLKSTYRDYLCSTETEVLILVKPDDWSPMSIDGITPPHDSDLMPSGERRFALTENLAEYMSSTKRSLGALEMHHSLIDIKRNITLLTVKYFTDGHGHTPNSCFEKDWFWHWRDKFSEQEHKFAHRIEESIPNNTIHQ